MDGRSTGRADRDSAALLSLFRILCTLLNDQTFAMLYCHKFPLDSIFSVYFPYWFCPSLSEVVPGDGLLLLLFFMKFTHTIMLCRFTEGCSEIKQACEILLSFFLNEFYLLLFQMNPLACGPSSLVMDGEIC